MGLVAVALITLGAINSALAMTVETCTGGTADSLMGGIYTLFLYAIGFGLLLWRHRPSWLYLSLIPAAIIAIWHTKFAVTFAVGYWLHDMGACFAMGNWEGADVFDFYDGREAFQTILWISLSLLFWLGISHGIVQNQREWRAYLR